MYKSIISLLLMALVAVAIAVPDFCPGHHEFPMEVTTPAGTFEGINYVQSRAFLGIPFAQPPVGTLRFAPPVPIGALSTPVNASSWPPSCFQSGVTSTVGYTQSEDCLYLNVFTPTCGKVFGSHRRPKDGLPVLVFIHGGRYWTGYSQQFPGDMMAAAQNAVVVSIQYRLNIYGFQAFDNNTNNGLLDQQLALQWVKDNIEYFGGNKDSITIFGESAGASSVLYHLINPNSWGSYSRAILQSVWQWYIPTAAESRAKQVTWAATKGCSFNNTDGTPNTDAILTCLRSVPASSLTPTVGNSDFTVPMIDGSFIKNLPLTSIRNNEYNPNAKIIMGHNYDEGNFMANSRLGFKAPGDPTVTNATAVTAIKKYLAVYFDSVTVDTILATYVPQLNELGPWYGAAQFFGDYYITCGSILAAEYFDEQNAGVRTYIYNYTSANYPASQWFNAASHGNELPYVFVQPIYTPYNFTTDDDVMADRMSGAWVDFAYNGNPSSIFNFWPSSYFYPASMYFGPDAYGFTDTRPYTKAICENFRVYFESH